MATTLAPGQRMSIATQGGTPSVVVRNEGPGSVILVREGAPPAEVSLGSPGVAELQAAAGWQGGFSVVNRSGLAATVDVQISGASDVRISGPAVPAAPK